VAVGVGGGHDQPVVEQPAVGQLGERVVVGLVLDPLLILLELGDVTEDAGVMGYLAVIVGDGGDGEQLGIDLAVLAPVPDLALPVAFLLELTPHGAVKALVVVARTQQARRLADGFLGAVAGQVGEGRIHGLDDAAGVGYQDAFQGGLDDALGQVEVAPGVGEGGVAFLQGLLQLLHVHVLHAGEHIIEADQAGHTAVVVGDGHVADAALHHAVARVEQASGARHALQRLARQVPGAALGPVIGQAVEDVALGQDTVGPVRLADEDGFGAPLMHLVGHLCHRIVAGHLDGRLAQDGVHLAQAQIPLDAVIQHHIRLRHHAAGCAVILHHQEVAQPRLAEAHGCLAQRGIGGQALHGRAHDVPDRGFQNIRAGHVQAQGVALGPQAQRFPVFHDHDGAATGAAHPGGRLRDGRRRRAFKDRRVHYLPKGQVSGHRVSCVACRGGGQRAGTLAKNCGISERGNTGACAAIEEARLRLPTKVGGCGPFARLGRVSRTKQGVRCGHR